AAKWTMCCPVPDATSRNTPLRAERSGTSTTAMGCLFRSAAGQMGKPSASNASLIAGSLHESTNTRAPAPVFFPVTRASLRSERSTLRGLLAMTRCFKSDAHDSEAPIELQNHGQRVLVHNRPHGSSEFAEPERRAEGRPGAGILDRARRLLGRGPRLLRGCGDAA